MASAENDFTEDNFDDNYEHELDDDTGAAGIGGEPEEAEVIDGCNGDDSNFGAAEHNDDSYPAEDSNDSRTRVTIDGGKHKAEDDSALSYRKLFVGGLGWNTTVESLKKHFSQFGVVEDATIKTDPQSGRSRGFGFVLFEDKDAVTKTLTLSEHKIDGKRVDPKPAKARGPPPVKKIFIGGLDPSVAETELRDYFGKFGKIEEIELPFDKSKNQRRAFGFVSFETEEIVNEICKQSKHMLGGKECDVKKATPKENTPQNNRRGGGRGGHGYGGYQGGGYQGGGGGYYNQGGGYGGGYGGGGGYDQYNQYGYGGGGGYYDQSGGGGYYGGGGYGGNQSGGSGGGGYGKAPKRGSSGNYHPYSRN